MLYGAPVRQDGSESLIFEPGSKWSIPLYTCASSSRAVIKTVNFRFNGTNGLQSLTVLNITNKVYANESAIPLWGVENTGLEISDAPPVWGLIDSKYSSNPGISTIRKESLWLPGTFNGLTSSECNPVATYQYLPGVSFFMDALTCAFGVSSTSTSTDVTDYSGQTNLAMYARWQQLSQTAAKVSKIINLIWTDVATSAVMGTKGWIPGSSSTPLQKHDGATSTQASPIQSTPVPIRIYSRQIQYHPLYAIPILLVALIAILMTLVSLALFLIGRFNLTVLRRHLTITSAGRLMTIFLYPDECNHYSQTKDWVRRVGAKTVSIRSSVPQAAHVAAYDNLGYGKPEDTVLLRPGTAGDGAPPYVGGYQHPLGSSFHGGAHEMQPQTPGMYANRPNNSAVYGHAHAQ